MWFFILSGVIVFAGQSASSSCPVSVSPPTAAVRIRDPFSANCSSLTDQVESMGWESSNGGVPLTNDVTSLPLNINSVTDWGLEPKCFINLLNGVQCSQKIQVTVYQTPDSVSLTPPNPTGPMIEGRQYDAECDFVNVAPVRAFSVRWRTGNEIISTDPLGGNIKYPVNTTSSFKLTAQRRYDGGEIWCEALMNHESTGTPPPPIIRSKSYAMAVLYPPAFTKPENETVEVAAGGKITLNCTAQGNPTPAYSWHLPHDVQRTDKTQKTDQPTLTPSFQLSGTYKCTASNSQGTSAKYFTVIETKRNRTTLAALVGGIAALGVLILVAGFFLVKPDGTCSCSKGSYLPTSSGAI